MTTPAVLPHRDAVLAALEGVGLTVGKGRAPDAADIPSSGAYAVLYFAPGQSESESLADQRTDFSGPFQVTCVGPTEEICLWVADRVRQGLFAAPLVAGRQAYRPREEGGPPVQRDDDVSPPLYFLPIQYTLRSTSA